MTHRNTTQVVALKAFECEVNGKRVFVNVGDVLRSDDPTVNGRKKLFKPKAELRLGSKQ